MTGAPDLRRAPPGPDRTLWWRWVRTVTAAEAAGFVTPALVGALLAGGSDRVMTIALVGAGAVEGALLGAGQAWVLRGLLPRFPVARYVGATALGAALAYAIAMVPVLLGDHLTRLPWWAQAGGGIVLGGALLATIGTTQWTVLRQLVPRAAWWIPATALGWAVALGAFLAVATPLWRPGQPLWLTVAIGAAAGVVMAAAAAAVTGVAVVRLIGARPAATDRATAPPSAGTRTRPRVR
jgi:hypothetical protein